MIQKYTLAFFLLLTCFCAHKSMAQTLPRPDHIIILIEENQPDSIVIGNTANAPYVNQLTHDTVAALFTNAYAIEHPSQPDYLDFFAGSNQGVTDDNVPRSYPFTTPNLGRQLMDAGLTFVTYSQDMPRVGYTGASYAQYVRKHNPVANWVGNGTNQVPASMNQPYTAFPTNFDSLPTICYVIPNEDSDMHNGTGNPPIRSGDFWFKEHLQSLVDWCRTHNSLFIYTFDEDDGHNNNNIPTLFYGSMVKPGTYTNHITLYDMLRTLEDMYGLGYAGNAATATTITNCWRSTSTGISTTGASAATMNVYPSPAANTVRFETTEAQTGAEITVSDISGRLIGQYDMDGSRMVDVNTSGLKDGLYFFQFNLSGRVIETGKFSIAR